MARRAAEQTVVTILWRDIPAQVNGQAGRERHQVVLSGKFQRAIDRAKRKANIYTADEDIAQWCRVTVRCEGDVVAAAEAEAARMETTISREYLGKLAYAGGFAVDIDDTVVPRAELLALEELDEPFDELLDEPLEPDEGGPSPRSDRLTEADDD
ncbi:MAG: virulence factor [Ilumatobacteraceae bacterium]